VHTRCIEPDAAAERRPLMVVHQPVWNKQINSYQKSVCLAKLRSVPSTTRFLC